MDETGRDLPRREVVEGDAVADAFRCSPFGHGIVTEDDAVANCPAGNRRQEANC